MGNRLSRIYTKTGDSGETGLGDGSRIDKTAPRVWAMGDIDELNSLVGILVSECKDPQIEERLRDVQHVLFNLGGEMSIPGSELVEKKHVSALEVLIDEYNENLPPLKEFILPGGSHAAGICHLARAVCRRAERRVLAVAGEENINTLSPIFLNRLSDLLFVLARVIARTGGGQEIYWESGRI